MIKLVTVLKRGAGLTRPEFEDRWLNVHAPIAAGFPNLRGYVLSFSILDGEPDADGVAQLWFDSRASAQGSYASDIGRNGSDDARRYLSRRDHLLVSEQWLRLPANGSARLYKLMVGIKRPAGQDRGAFVAAIQALDLDAIAGALGSDAVRLCVDEAGKQLNSGVDGSLDLYDAEAAFDAILEAWYPDADELRSAASRLGQNAVSQQIAASGSTEVFLLKENVVLAPPDSVQPTSLLSGKNDQ